MGGFGYSFDGVTIGIASFVLTPLSALPTLPFSLSLLSWLQSQQVMVEEMMASGRTASDEQPSATECDTAMASSEPADVECQVTDDPLAKARALINSIEKGKSEV